MLWFLLSSVDQNDNGLKRMVGFVYELKVLFIPAT